MKSLLLFLVGLTCSAYSEEFVTLIFDTNKGETIFFRVTPKSVRLSKLGQPRELTKNIDEGHYLQILEAVQGFTRGKGRATLIGDYSEHNSKSRNILLLVDTKTGSQYYSMVGTLDDIAFLIIEFQEHLGEKEVNRFINQYLAEPFAAVNADKPPV